MELELYVILILMLVAFSAGFVDSVAGGGGLLMMPALLLAGISPLNALGTNKFVAIFGTGTAMLNFILKGKMLWKVAIIGVIFAMIGSVCGTNAILLFDEKAVTKIILTLLPFTAIVTFIPKKKLKSSISEFTSKELYIFAPLVSFVLGFYDGFFGPGTGTFLIIGFYAILGMNMVNASAVAKAINFSSGLGSFITFAIGGKVLYMVGLPLLFSNMLGAYLGSKMAMTKGQGFIKIMIIGVFVLLFVSLFVKYYNN